ncbi:AtpZ/AtpI family protein [Candidatus Odyssella thessalonicensis]|uniref:AtpZ/AtpI family protein n=1 Tax=Candidatus Odyssella thessalonicensis TaxID=84647 RepID=UPI0003193B9D|nr:AtpZ/AtpI family protein [Candidatus Odyssella thessalonicensis]
MTDNTSKPQNSMTSFVLRAGTEFTSGIFVGVIFGLAIDHFFNTKPFGLIIMILLGAAAGFRNIFKLVCQNFSTVKSNHPHGKPSDLEKKP